MVHGRSTEYAAVECTQWYSVEPGSDIDTYSVLPPISSSLFVWHRYSIDTTSIGNILRGPIISISIYRVRSMIRWEWNAAEHETGLTAFLSFAAFLLLLSVHSCYSCRQLADTCKSRFQAANQPLATEMRVGSNPDWTYSVHRAPPPVGQYGNNTRRALRGPFVHLFGLRSSVWLHFLCRLSHSPFCSPSGLLSLSVNYISSPQLSTPFDFNIRLDFYSRKRYASFVSLCSELLKQSPPVSSCTLSTPPMEIN